MNSPNTEGLFSICWFLKKNQGLATFLSHKQQNKNVHNILTTFLL